MFPRQTCLADETSKIFSECYLSFNIQEMDTFFIYDQRALLANFRMSTVLNKRHRKINFLPGKKITKRSILKSFDMVRYLDVSTVKRIWPTNKILKISKAERSKLLTLIRKKVEPKYRHFFTISNQRENKM